MWDWMVCLVQGVFVCCVVLDGLQFSTWCFFVLCGISQSLVQVVNYALYVCLVQAIFFVCQLCRLSSVDQSLSYIFLCYSFAPELQANVTDYLFGVYDHNEGADQDEYVDWFEHNDTGIAPRK